MNYNDSVQDEFSYLATNSGSQYLQNVKNTNVMYSFISFPFQTFYWTPNCASCAKNAAELLHNRSFCWWPWFDMLSCDTIQSLCSSADIGEACCWGEAIRRRRTGDADDARDEADADLEWDSDLERDLDLDFDLERELERALSL